MYSLNQSSLLGAVAAGKILFQHQPQLTDAALRKRILRLRTHSQLPMVRLNGKYVISVRKLKQWLKENNL
jgi:glutaredoxin|tara:strand:+ start:1117 stop:1326 length:210 start_codon:yes stop_codon:yes gene_type:complete